MDAILIVLVIVVIVVILVAVCQCCSGSSRHATPRLTDEARRMFVQYIEGNNAARNFEETRSNMRDIAHRPDKFFAKEIHEPEHADVLRSAREHGAVTGPDMQRWIDENAAEIASGKSPFYKYEAS